MRSSFKSYLWPVNVDLIWTLTHPHCPGQENGNCPLSVADKGDLSLFCGNIKMLWQQMCPVLLIKKISNMVLIKSCKDVSCMILLVLPSELGESAFCMFTRATSASTGALEQYVKCLAGSVLIFTGMDWNLLNIFFICIKINFGINHVSSSNWSCIKLQPQETFRLLQAFVIPNLQAGLLLWAFPKLCPWIRTTLPYKPIKMRG